MGMLLAVALAANITVSGWNYPLDDYQIRDSYKGFGQLITAEFYEQNSDLYPTKYEGYHTGKDVEILPGEENGPVEVKAITDGVISFVGVIGGYGGVVLQQLNDENLTVIYGHVDVETARVKAGDRVKSKDPLAQLGDGFSKEAGGERKHLHLGVYKGQGREFRGYTTSLTELNNKWVDPEILFLPEPTQPVVQREAMVIQKREWWQELLSKVKEFWYNLWHGNK